MSLMCTCGFLLGGVLFVLFIVLLYYLFCVCKCITFFASLAHTQHFYGLFCFILFHCTLILKLCIFQMFLTVFLSNNDQHFTEVPITPETMCRDVIELCKEPGQVNCHLTELWRGSGENLNGIS